MKVPNRLLNRSWSEQGNLLVSIWARTKSKKGSVKTTLAVKICNRRWLLKSRSKLVNIIKEGVSEVLCCLPQLSCSPNDLTVFEQAWLDQTRESCRRESYQANEESKDGKRVVPMATTRIIAATVAVRQSRGVVLSRGSLEDKEESQ